MKKLATILCVSLTSAVLAEPATIVCPADAPANVKLATKEVRRYVYLRTGELATISENRTYANDRTYVSLAIDPALGAQEYRLKSDGRSLTISGGSDVAVLYGAYAFAEKLGVRFYLHGDVIPDAKIPFALPKLDETGNPIFNIRGIQPFHDFPEGPDWWNQDDYLAYVGQLAKMRMNFLGLHTYPEGGVGPEPLVWIGLPQDVNADGTVKFSYPSRWFNTASPGWGYAPMKTSEFTNGAALLFPEDAYGPEVHAGMMPRPATPEASNELFNRVGKQMGVVFAAAKKLGVKTCLGTETPLIVPKAVRDHLKQLGKDPADPKVVQELYEGMFKRISTICPADYYWLWTPEGWTWGGNNPDQFGKTTRDIQAALDAIKTTSSPFTLATSGWVLGPQHDRAALDAFLPKASPMSCINRNVGHDPVETAFANIQGRPKWAIPWMENDPNMVGYQPWAARMRADAVDAKRLGCTGLLGIHWRTKALAPNVAALAGAAWDQSWVPAGHDLSPVKPARSASVGGSCVSFTAPVAKTDHPAIYQSVRYDVSNYYLEIPSGTYTVTLEFNEPHYEAPGKRVFGAQIQGKTVIEKLDMFATLGRNQAYDVKVPEVQVTDGKLKIDFIRIVEFPCIAGIVIEGMTAASNQIAAAPFTRKINCGGPAIAGYEADLGSGSTAISTPARAMPVGEFYADFARAHFGDAVATEAGALMASLDGNGFRPNPADWHNGPGNLNTNSGFRGQAKAKGAIVAKFAALRPKVTGAGNLERFDYWLNTFQVSVDMYELAGIRGDLDAAVKKLNAEKEAAKKQPLAEAALKLRLELVQAWNFMMQTQVSIADTPGELGTIANLEQHSRITSAYLTGYDKAIADALGKPLPPEAKPGMEYNAPARLTVLTVRSSIAKGETLRLPIIALDKTQVKSVVVKIRPLGKGDWQTLAAKHLGRAVWQATLPAATDDFEYQVEAETANGKKLAWPPTAPQMNQTVVDTE
jgi:hypothetical protein